MATPTVDTGEWTVEIRSKPGLLDIDFKDLWRYRDLIALMVRRDFVSAYKQTILGPLWHLTEPIVTALTYALIFGVIANLSSDGLPRILFYLSGITMWTYFSNCLLGITNMFQANASIFGKVYFPRLVVPLSIVMSRLTTFGLQFLVLVLIAVYYYVQGVPIHFGLNALLIPVLVLLVMGLSLGLGLIVASIATKYRDFKKLITVSMRLLMFAAPVIYPLSSVSEENRWIIELNPMTPIIEAFRFALLGVGTLSANGLWYSAGVMVVVVLIGLMMFSRSEKVFMDTV